MTVLRVTCCLLEEREAVKEAALLVGATVSGRYLGGVLRREGVLCMERGIGFKQLVYIQSYIYTVLCES